MKSTRSTLSIIRTFNNKFDFVLIRHSKSTQLRIFSELVDLLNSFTRDCNMQVYKFYEAPDVLFDKVFEFYLCLSLSSCVGIKLT